MIVITVARKPLSTGTVATNVLAHGCGALHIEAIRVGTSANDAFGGGAVRSDSTGITMGTFPESYEKGSGWVAGSPKGRWPANLVLGHMDGCQQEGTRNVRSNGHYPAVRGRGSEISCTVGHMGQDGLQERHMDGETVAAWRCVEGCPVAELDEQSGISQSSVGTQKYKRADTSGWVERGGSFTPGREWDAEGYGDTGGASRYFKQVGGSR